MIVWTTLTSVVEDQTFIMLPEMLPSRATTLLEALDLTL
jgi:hypothetical protein